MEFIKAFLLFLFFVVIMGVVLFIIVYTIYFSIMSLKALRRRMKKETPYYTRSLKPSIKLLKTVSVFYLLSCLVFYYLEVKEYLLQDRPYKEAKAYAIAGEYLLVYQLLIGNFKTADTFYYRALQYLQREFVLKNIYRLIPQSDGEREIWNYHFQQQIYARSFWAPVVQPNIRKNYGQLWIFASYEPEIKILINNIYNSIINLDTLPIEDKKFSSIDRYLLIASMARYYDMYAEQEVNPVYENGERFGEKGSKQYIQFTDPYYINKYDNFLKAVDNTKYAMDNSKELKKAFLFWAGTKAYSNKIFADIYIIELVIHQI